MTHWTEAADLIESDGERGVFSRVLPGALAFTLSAAIGVWVVYFRPISHIALLSPPLQEQMREQAKADPYGGLAPVTLPPQVTLGVKPVANPFGGLVLQGFNSSARFAVAEVEPPTPPVAPRDLRDGDDSAPTPPRRPSSLGRAPEPAPSAVARLEPRPAPATPATAPSASPSSGSNVFERLFGGSTQQQKSAEPALAYAAPPPPSAGVSVALAGRSGAQSGGGFGDFLHGLNFGGGGGSSPASRYGDRVAVYDITAHVVYLPDGTKLEAHSGLGEARDDPNRVNQPMRGATPPATYALEPRETSFHGVDALRLRPVDSNVYGRAGLLAHSYMLGPNGDSNGCVSFRDYDAFLRAYRSGQINKLVVVTRL